MKNIAIHSLPKGQRDIYVDHDLVIMNDDVYNIHITLKTADGVIKWALPKSFSKS